jgi:predicted ATPase/class 3 adenylate cyclase
MIQKVQTELGGMSMRCQSCSAENPETAKFCIQCASPFKRRCERCGFENPPGARFCAECAAPLAVAVEQSSNASATPASSAIRVTPDYPEPQSIDGERKTVTALFADIKGSMDLIEDIDPEDARAIVDPAIKLMIGAAHRYDGYIVQSTGDGIFALFGAPVAREDHPQRALYAALRMQEDVKRFAEKLRAEKGVNLQVRVGVNTGEVVVRSIRTDDAHTEYTPIGHSTSLASRLQTLAAPGSIAISETVRNLIEGYFALKPLGPARIKGVSEPVNVYEVTGLGPLRTRLQRSAGRGFTKFVGRHREIEAMKAAAEQTIAGHGQIVAAIAEAGIGKSRLFFEFKAVESSKWMILEASSVSHGKASAFLPVIDLLWDYFKISDEDDDRSRREKVAGRLAILDPSLESTRPYLFTLLGIVEGDEHYRRWEQTFDRLDEYLHGLQKKDPLAQMDAQIRRRRTLDAIKKILLRESLNQPLMLIFEDLHWIDDETQSLLDLLADSIGTSRVLILVNYRPEYSHAWTNKTYYSQLRLDPLGKDNGEEMLRALVGDDASLKPLCDLIVQKTEGNPFFMEEIVQGLIEDGALIRNGITKVVRPLDTIKIPATVQAILASRIDRLPATEKDLLQTVAAIGKEFGLGLVRAVTNKSDDLLAPTLSALQLAEFIYEQPAMGDVVYTFKHALTQEVAYRSLLVERRTLIHERIGAGIEAIFAQSLDDHLGKLAHHYGRSANRSKAIEYFERAGRRALQQSAFSEAIDHARRGLALITGASSDPQVSRHELELQSTLGDALGATRGYADPQVKITLERARALCIEAGDSARLFTVLIGLRWFCTFRLEMNAACDIARQLVELAERLGDPSKLAEARFALGHTLFLTGEFSAAAEPIEQQLSARDGSHVHSSYLAGDPEALVLALASWVLWCRGYPDRARRRSEEALTLARTLSQPYSLTLVTVFAAQLHKFLREGAATRNTAQAAMDLAAQAGFGLQLAQATVLRGAGLLDLEKFEQGVSEVRQAIDAVEATGAIPRSMYLALLGEGYLKGGRVEEGLACVATALARSEKSGEHSYDAELMRLRGEMLLKADPPVIGDAEHSFHLAIDLARSQDAKSWELRATTSLARMLRDTNRRDEARAILADIYSWFTEGFDTADLKDAKALLDSLST